ncbi:Mediator of RNA polymerase II transcription subunit 15a [Acorus calamus]|uniref:Mediator of RNA polymerase II transcription subunit 15a n=1 Tax=Acorus calamus TaxID=4465 RepID=A0AAV9F190_ACOCL|nr:Mediator of RNA polymerase II transcription subunit 15a [Acorus calamus]
MTDYLRKISLKMLTMEQKTQNLGGANPLPPNAGSGSQNPPDIGLVRGDRMCRGESYAWSEVIAYVEDDNFFVEYRQDFD